MLASFEAKLPWVEDQWLWSLGNYGTDNHWPVNIERPQVSSNPLRPITVRGNQPLNGKISFWSVFIPYINPNSGFCIGVGTEEASLEYVLTPMVFTLPKFGIGFCNRGLIWQDDTTTQYSKVRWPDRDVCISILEIFLMVH